MDIGLLESQWQKRWDKYHNVIDNAKVACEENKFRSKKIKEHEDYFSRFDKIVTYYDNDQVSLSTQSFQGMMGLIH